MTLSACTNFGVVNFFLGAIIGAFFVVVFIVHPPKRDDSIDEEYDD